MILIITLKQTHADKPATFQAILISDANVCPFFRENPEQFPEEKLKTKRTEAVMVMSRISDISTSLLSSNGEINVSERFSVPEPYRRTYAIVYKTQALAII